MRVALAWACLQVSTTLWAATWTNGAGLAIEIHSRREWNTQKSFILESMQEVMGPMPGREKKAPLTPRLLEELDLGDHLRHKITYVAEPGDEVPAYLLIPKAVIAQKKKAPGVLCLHQTHPLGFKVVVGLGPDPNDEYALELVRRGYVCLAPAYPRLAEYQPDLKRLGYESGTMKAIWNNRRGLDFLESLPFVEKGAFGAIGHSLGGHNALYTAAFDSRIRVVATSCGFDSYRDYMNGDIRGWTSDRYMPRLLRYSPDRYPFDFQEVLAAIAPRPVFVNAPLKDSNFKWASVDRVAASVRPVYEFLGAPEGLQVEHPDAAHSFPPEMRRKAYELFDRVLKRR